MASSNKKRSAAWDSEDSGDDRCSDSASSDDEGSLQARGAGASPAMMGCALGGSEASRSKKAANRAAPPQVWS